MTAEYDNGAAPGSPSREYIYSGGALLAKIDSTGTRQEEKRRIALATRPNGSSGGMRALGKGRLRAQGATSVGWGVASNGAWFVQGAAYGAVISLSVDALAYSSMEDRFADAVDKCFHNP